MIVGLLVGLAKANLAMGAAVLAVLALRGQVRPRFGARAAYALWLAPLVSHFSEQKKLTPEDIAELKKLIEELEP